MEKLNNQFIFRLGFVFFLFFLNTFTITTYGQAQIQKMSMRAPVGIRIDGKTLEWPDNKLNANNLTDNIWYSITNDDDNLYLTVRGPYLPPAEKIFSGGITFTISRSLDKKERVKNKDNVSVTFPVVKTPLAKDIMAKVMTYTGMRSDTAAKKKEHDALVDVVNAKTIDALKEIKVVGIKDIPDTLISIYNTTGIKAMGSFNRGMAFTVEMAVPLKYLGLSINDSSIFSYNIMINGASFVSMPFSGGSGEGLSYRIIDVDSIKGGGVGDIGYITNTTDFWAEYSLAKKQ